MGSDDDGDEDQNGGIQNPIEGAVIQFSLLGCSWLAKLNHLSGCGAMASNDEIEVGEIFGQDDGYLKLFD